MCHLAPRSITIGPRTACFKPSRPIRRSPENADTPISRKQRHPFDRFYNFFSRSAWTMHDLAREVAVTVVVRLNPRGVLHLVVDDTLLHKRGKHVYGLGWFRDAVASTAKRVDRSRVQIEQAGDGDSIAATLVSREHRKTVPLDLADAKHRHGVVHQRGPQASGSPRRPQAFGRLGYRVVVASYASRSPQHNSSEGN